MNMVKFVAAKPVQGVLMRRKVKVTQTRNAVESNKRAVTLPRAIEVMAARGFVRAR